MQVDKPHLPPGAAEEEDHTLVDRSRPVRMSVTSYPPLPNSVIHKRLPAPLTKTDKGIDIKVLTGSAVKTGLMQCALLFLLVSVCVLEKV